MTTTRSFTLVLGGGGMKGLAHIGVLAALEQRGWQPARIIGNSVGALVAAAWLSGLTARELEEMALQLQRRDLFRVAHRNMALKRMRSPALYHGEPLEHFARGLLGDVTFDELRCQLLVNTVDLDAGMQVFWGTDGFRDVPVVEAVIASCALPGYLPPREIRGRFYVDGASVANFPIRAAAALEQDLVIGVDVGSSGMRRTAVAGEGFAAVYGRAIELGIEMMRNTDLLGWTTPPLVLIQPQVEDVGLLAFNRNAELVEAGYRAALETIDEPGAIPPASAVGVFPRRLFEVRVLRERCVGCGACLVHGRTGLFQLDAQGKAVLGESHVELPAAEARYVMKQCPTDAIEMKRASLRGER